MLHFIVKMIKEYKTLTFLFFLKKVHMGSQLLNWLVGTIVSR